MSLLLDTVFDTFRPRNTWVYLHGANLMPRRVVVGDRAVASRYLKQARFPEGAGHVGKAPAVGNIHQAGRGKVTTGSEKAAGAPARMRALSPRWRLPGLRERPAVGIKARLWPTRVADGGRQLVRILQQAQREVLS